jgi:thymidylate kinase
MKIAFSGTHGTGKSTSCLKMAASLKIDNPNSLVGILTENIINCPYPINNATKDVSQLWIFADQLKSELEYMSKYDIVVCDRCVMDCVAYTKAYDFNIWKELFEIAKYHILSYHKIYIKSAIRNKYVFKDKLRMTDFDFRQEVEDILIDLFKATDANYEII